MKKPYVLLLSSLLLALVSFVAGSTLRASDIAIGHWRHHLPNNTITRLAETGKYIVGATPYGMVAFNKADNSMKRINKVDGLNDFGLSAIQWSEKEEVLMIGYENGNLDFMINDRFINVPDIMQASILGSKRINQIVPYESSALLACDFGVVELDIANRLIMDTWFIGPFGSMVNVHDILVTDTVLFAATNAGLLHASAEATNLADYRNWHRMTVSGQENETFMHIVKHHDRIFISRSDTDTDILYYFNGGEWVELSPPQGFDGDEIKSVRSSAGNLVVASGNRLDVFDGDLNVTKQLDSYYGGTPNPNDAIYDSGGRLWIADDRSGLVKQHGPQSYERIILEGMDYADAFGLAARDGRIWVAPGGKSYIGSNEWNNHGYYFFEDGKWTRYRRSQFPLLDNVRDIIHITVDPANSQKAYASAWFGGMVVVGTEGAIKLYDETNSTLRKRSGLDDYLRVGGTAMDNQGTCGLPIRKRIHPCR